MPPTGGTSRPVHVSQQPFAHDFAVSVLRRETCAHLIVILIDLCVEVRAAYVYETKLGPIWRGWILVRHVAADPRHGQAQDGAQCFQGRRWSKVRLS